MKFLAFFLFLGIACSISAQTKKEWTIDEYIQTYKDVAIREMEASGIPASITLAQGIHESRFGNSALATKANNHFGIKCGSKWTGKTYYRWDDDIAKSCFRVYKSAEQSYSDHTEFLQKSRYAFLFKYDRTDYKRWAKGLKKAGYATDPKYPSKLINAIEKYNLSIYDTETGVIAIKPVTIDEEGDESMVVRTKQASFLFPVYKRGIYEQGGKRYIIAKKTDSPLSLANNLDISYKRILRYNDLNDGDEFIENQYVFIQPKRKRYRGDETFHRVDNGETMYEIAQYYGVRLKVLRKLNLLKKGEEPAEGELVVLKERALDKPLLRTANYVAPQPKKVKAAPSTRSAFQKEPKKTKKSYVVVNDDVKRPEPQKIDLDESIHVNKVDSSLKVSDNTKPQNNSTSEKAKNNLSSPFGKIKKSPIKKSPTSPVVKDNFFKVKPNKTKNQQKNTTPKVTPAEPSIPTNKVLLHTVKDGETLYRLQVKYKVPWNEIKAYNDLQSNELYLGQQIKIPVK